MPKYSYKNLPSLKKYVRIKEDKNIKELEKAGYEWLTASLNNNLSYELEWLGVPIIQTAEDIVLMQELIFKVQPDVIVETGVAHGGSLVFYASLLELINKKGKVIGIDIDIRKHNRKVIEGHPLAKRIKLIEGSSTDPKIVMKAKKMIPKNAKVMVLLDSDHTRAHVLKELEQYAPFVSKNSYIVAFDTVVQPMIKVRDPKYIDNSPMEAVWDFLKANKNFEIDKTYNRLFVSYSPDGFLKRTK